MIIALQSKFPGLTEKKFMEDWDYEDVSSAIRAAGFDENLLNYIFEKDLSGYKLGDVIK